uniref:Secreted protein n=1 Tax=Mesocestoides corti TaxID=53468 RepID=A0A5K3G2E5_MESCO
MRVHHAGHAMQYLLFLIQVFILLVAYLPCMLLQHRETEDCLRPVWSNMSSPLCIATIRFGPMVWLSESKAKGVP